MESPCKDCPLRSEMGPYAPVIAEDLLRGLNDWKSVPDIVRLTLKSLTDVLKSQGATLRELEMQVPGKASRAELGSALAAKANISEVTRTVAEVRSALEAQNSEETYNRGVSRYELQHLLANKVSYEELRTALDSKAGPTGHPEEIRATRAVLEEIQQVKANKQSVANALHRKVDKVDLEAEMTEVTKAVSQVSSDFSRKAQELEYQIRKTAESTEEKLRTLWKQNSENTQQMNESQNELYRDFEDCKLNIKDFRDSLNRSHQDLRVLLNTKGDAHEILALATENGARLIQHETNSLRTDLQALKDEFLAHNSENDFTGTLSGLRTSVEELFRMTRNLRTELATKTPLNEFSAYVQEQNSVNGALCAETCTGRWLWKSGQIGTDSSVSWGLQNTNTCPENFVWEENTASILTVNPGLYEVSFGVFGDNSPEFYLQVNGEPIISNGIPLAKSMGRHSSGTITGTTALDFVILPARARLSLVFSKETASEGFFGIRKL